VSKKNFIKAIIVLIITFLIAGCGNKIQVNPVTGKSKENQNPQNPNQGNYNQQGDPLSILDEGKIEGVIFRLGDEKKEIVSKLGEPDSVEKIGGSEEFRYKDTYYYFHLINGTLIGVKIAKKGTEVFGVKIGMKPEEVKAVLGKPANEYYNVHDEHWSMLYQRGKTELYFVSKERNSSTLYMQVSKKN